MLASSIFLDFNLPNATTWFYFSLLLAVALFFKFSRLLSFRNWDLLTIYLLVPGLLLVQEARPGVTTPERHPATAVTSVVGAVGGQAVALPATGVTSVSALARTNELTPPRTRWLGYLWLLAGSAYLLLRCLIDLALQRRPALAPNLSFGGMAWLAGALFVCLIAVAFRSTDHPPPPSPTAQTKTTGQEEPAKVGKESVALDLAQRPFENWVMRAVAVACHLAVVLGLIVLAWRHFQDAATGMAAATFYLMLPYTGYHVGQVHHVWPMALVVWALVLYRTPTFSGMLLGLAAGTIYFPALLLPLWLSFYRGRGTWRFLAMFLLTAGLALAVVGVVLWCSDDLARRVSEAIALSDWQPWKVPNAVGVWTGVHWAYRIPVFIAYLAFVLTTAFWPSPKNLGHLIALSAAVLIGIQFWYADQGGVYVLWYLPLFLLMMFRPNLSDRLPPPIARDGLAVPLRPGAGPRGAVAAETPRARGPRALNRRGVHHKDTKEHKEDQEEKKPFVILYLSFLCVPLCLCGELSSSRNLPFSFARDPLQFRVVGPSFPPSFGAGRLAHATLSPLSVQRRHRRTTGRRPAHLRTTEAHAPAQPPGRAGGRPLPQRPVDAGRPEARRPRPRHPNRGDAARRGDPRPDAAGRR